MNKTRQVHGVFDPEHYDRFIRSIVPSQPALLSCLLDYLPPDPRRILELGCGTGLLTEQIQKACPAADITGIDLAPEMLALAAAKPGLKKVRFLSQDLRDPWPDGRYDAILTSLCIHHILPEERVSVAVRAARMLSPGGRFLCGDVFRPEHDWEEEVLREIWRQGMRRGGAPEDVIQGMIAQREAHMPTFTTVPWYRDRLLESGFSHVMIPFTYGFVGLVVGFAP
jgi:tRNA (cmo5U34)-methyltransferase